MRSRERNAQARGPLGDRRRAYGRDQQTALKQVLADIDRLLVIPDDDRLDRGLAGNQLPAARLQAISQRPVSIAVNCSRRQSSSSITFRLANNAAASIGGAAVV